MNKFKIYILLLIVFTLGFLSHNVVSFVSAHGGDLSLIHACVRPAGFVRYPDGTNSDMHSNTCEGHLIP